MENSTHFKDELRGGRPSMGGRMLPEFVKRMNDAMIVVLQIEHIDAGNNIDQMLAVRGISSLVIGSNDLSTQEGAADWPREPRR